MIWSVEVVVQLKPAVNDPQGLVVRDGLRRLGFDGVAAVRVGKHITVEVDAVDSERARDSVAAMCEQLLRNPVIEEYRIVAVAALAADAAS